MATHIPTTSRRWLLAAATPAVLMLSGVTVAAPATINPDAALIGLCAEFEALERKIEATFGGIAAIADDDSADAATEALRVEQDPIIDAITACRPTTLAGFTALAGIAMLWRPELIEASPAQGDTGERLIAALVRGLTGGAAA